LLIDGVTARDISYIHLNKLVVKWVWEWVERRNNMAEKFVWGAAGDNYQTTRQRNATGKRQETVATTSVDWHRSASQDRHRRRPRKEIAT